MLLSIDLRSENFHLLKVEKDLRKESGETHSPSVPCLPWDIWQKIILKISISAWFDASTDGSVLQRSKDRRVEG
jgi:hypothetical protein